MTQRDRPWTSLVAQLQCRRPWFDSWVGRIHWRRDRLPTPVFLGFHSGSAGKESTCNVGDLDSIPGLERSPEEVNNYPLQFSGLENSLDCQLNMIWFLLNSSKGNIIIKESRLRVSWSKVLDQGSCLQKVMRTIFRAVETFCILIVVVPIWLYIF